MNVFEQAMEVCHSHDYHISSTNPDTGPAALIERLEAEGLLRSDEPEPDEVMAFRTYGNNADIIADCFKLDYLTDEMNILDATYGKGTFWKKHRPPLLVGTDLDPAKSPGGSFDRSGGTVHIEPGHAIDFTKTPWEDGHYDAVVFDPDYKMQGTSSNAGPASSNPAYGMDREYRSVAAQMGIIGAGLVESHRVTQPDGMVLVKCMSQVVSGDVTWQDYHIRDVMVYELGCQLVDRFWLLGYRKQPERTHKCPRCNGTGIAEYTHDDPHGKPARWSSGPCDRCRGLGREASVQQHARQNASCLLVFRKAKS